MALLDTLFGPRTPYNPYDPAAAQTPQPGNSLRNNSTALTMAGLGLLGGQDNPAAFRNAASGLALGMQFDQSRRERQRQERERAAARNATMDYLRTTGRYGEDQLNAAQGSPAVMSALLQQSFAVPKERRIIQGADGFQYFADTGERVLPGVKAQPEFAKDRISAANALRDDLRTDLASANLVSDGAKTIQTLYENPGAVSDYALAVAFAKIVDPGSVAREGEVAAVQNAGARFPQYLQSLKNAISGEGAMNPAMRQEIAVLAANMANQKIGSAQETLGNYETAAGQMDIPFNWIYQGGGFSPIPMPQALTPGTPSAPGTGPRVIGVRPAGGQ